MCNLVDLAGQLAHFASRLFVGGAVDRLEDDVLQVRVHCVLVRLDHLLEDLVLFPASSLLHLPLAALLRLANTTLSLGQHAEGVDAALLLQTDELLAEEVKRVADALSLELRQDLINEVLLKTKTFQP